jgi:hypothetical protein
MLAIGSLSAGAVAAPNPGPGSDGPQSANVPYVAWVGEHVRLVACDPVINSSYQFANYSVEDWSGYQFQPPTPDGDAGNNIGQIFDPGPSAFFTSSDQNHETEEEGHEGCVATDYKSLNPGLSRIRLVVRDQGTDAIVFSHQFLVIWLTANQPTISEAGLTAKGSETFQDQTSQSALSSYLGDPEGNGVFAPSPFNPQTAPNQDKGLIQIKVTGSFPVVHESPLSNILSNSSYTLPDDWVTLADILASSSEEKEPPGSNPGLWDIHGTPSEATTANAASSAGPLNADFFRPAFGNFTSGETATVGPYDPQAADETLLSDGRLNTDDAPMPAIRVDLRIAPNEGGSDLGGVGQISGASKAQIYSHNFDGNAEAEGNLYNPYYGEYIPSTDRPVNEASGIDGSSPGGDFPGFINKHPEPYTFWNSVLSGEPREAAHPTGCLRRAPGKSTDATPEDDYFTPTGYLRESFYTDERGEVYATYTPGDGFYLERLGLTTDSNEGCDLSSLFDQEIGHSSISAKVVYPYEPVDYQPLTSESITKTVKSLWRKETYEFPKGTNPGDENVRILVAKAQDIDGLPIVDEEVCFNATADSSVTSFDGHVTDTEGVLGSPGAIVYLNGSYVRDPADEGSNHLCETTNSQGLAGIEVTNSTESGGDVTTHFINEGITRDRLFDFSTNEGSKKAKIEKEAKEAEEKQKHEEQLAEEKQHHEEALAAEKKRHEEEEAATKKRHEEEAEAEKKHHEKEAEEAKTAEEKAAIEAKNKATEEERAKIREAEAIAETAKHKAEEEAAAAAAAAQAKALLTPLPGALATTSTTTTTTGSAGAGKGVDAFASSKGHAKKHKKHKKAKKSKKHKRK